MGNTAGQRTVSLRGQGRPQSSATAAMPSRWIRTACARGLRVPMLACALAALMLVPQAAQARVADSDHDGLSNRLEKRKAHTNPRKADTDGDGLRDKYELRRAHTNPRKKDTDRDGLSDGFEVNGSRTSPRRKDTDGDGLSDRYEVKRSKTSPRRKDTDGDGLSDGYEIKESNTSPRRADDDGDGLKDGVEVLFGLDPTTAPGDPDVPVPPVDPAPDDPAPPDDPPPPDDPDNTDHVAPNTALGAGGPSGTSTTGSATLLVLVVGAGLDLRVPARRRRLEPVHLAQGLHGAQGGLAHLLRARPGRRRQPRRVPGSADLGHRPPAAPRHPSPEHRARLGRSGRDRDLRHGELHVLVIRVGLDVPVQARRRRVGRLHDPEGLLEPRGGPAQLLRPCHRRVRQHRPAPGSSDLDHRLPGTSAATTSADLRRPRRLRRPAPPTCSSRHRATTRLRAPPRPPAGAWRAATRWPPPGT